MFSSRLLLGMQRCEKSLQYLFVAYNKGLPIVNLSGHALENLGRYRLYVCIPDQSNYYLVSVHTYIILGSRSYQSHWLYGTGELDTTLFA